MSASARAHTEPMTPLEPATGGITVRRLGAHTCVVTPPADFLRGGAASVEDVIGNAVARGCDDFVFDFATVRRWDTQGLRQIADLWRRLALLECGVYVVASDAGFCADLRRLPAQDAWSVRASIGEALQALFARPA